MPTSPPSITAPPTMPDRSDRASFPVRAQNWTVWQRDSEYPQLAALGSNVYGNATEAYNSAISAAANATAAASASGAVMWVSGTSYAQGIATWSPTNGQTFRRTGSTPGASTTDPSADATRWVQISGAAGSAITSINGISGPGAINIPIPVTSVNGKTGALTVNFADLGAKPTTRAGYGITDAGFTTRTSAIQSTFANNGANEFWICTYSGQSNFTLASGPSDGQRERVLFTNGRLDNKVWVSGGLTLLIGNNYQVGPASEYVVIDTAPHAIREFVYIGSLSIWEPA